MKVTLNIAGTIFVLFGAIWFLQGINVLPGSFMTGQTRWAVYGGGERFDHEFGSHRRRSLR
jgi:hypothetical protein